MKSKSNLKLVASFMCIFAAVSFEVRAEDSIDLNVKGTLTVGACTPTLTNSEGVDYGDVFVKDLNRLTQNDLGEKDTSLHISCASPQKVYLTEDDDRKDSVVNTLNVHNLNSMYYFGLGSVDDTQVPIGSYLVESKKVTVDGVQGKIYASDFSGAWSNVNPVQFIPDPTASMGRISFGNNSSSTPTAFSDVVMDLNIYTVVQAANTLNIQENTPIDGQATITLNYF